MNAPHHPVGTTLMTGASRGIGRVAAELLLRRQPGHHFVVLARTGAGGLAAGLARYSGNPLVTGIDADLSSLAETRRAAVAVGEWLDRGELPPLRGFLGNAGVVLASTAHATADGHEMTFGVNVLSHYLLVRLLLDRFTAPARIVLTTSDSHFGTFRYTLGTTPPPRWTGAASLATPRPGGISAGGRAYATSKLGTVYLAHALARRLPPGVDVYSYNPSLVPGTELLRDAPAVLRTLLAGFFRVQLAAGRGMRPERAGALLAEAVAGPPPGPTGSYLDRGRVVPSSAESYDEAHEEELWQDAARLAGLA